MVVDDEESVALTMGAILEMDGYEVETHTRGRVALEHLRQQTFDLVLTDLRLDDVDGLEIVGEVCRNAPDTLAIILTGYASLDTAVKALRQGAYDYLFKPCDVEELKATVARGVERRSIGLQLKARVRELETANELIRTLNAGLQERVDEATAALRQRMAELAQANDEIAHLYAEAQEHVVELEKLDELKSRFLSMASHELKTPLTSISGLSQLVVRHMQRRLAAGRPDAEEWEREQRAHLERLEILKAQTAKLARLVDELLDVSRIESGRVEFHFAPVDVPRLVKEVANRFQVTTLSHEIVVSTARAKGAEIVEADQDHIEQVLNNLIGNAIKYSPEGGRITVEVSPDEGGGGVVVSVQDRGVGIPPHQLEAVFDLFHRAQEPGSRASGMGLGLYISKEIVQRHGGRIWAESAPGRGSTFYVALPRVPAEANERAATAA